MERFTLGLLEAVANCPQAKSWPKRKKHGWTTYHLVCRFPVSTKCSMIFQLIPVGCPNHNHFAVGDGYALLKLLEEVPEYNDLIIFKEDLAGFFIRIEPNTFLGSRHMLLDFLRPHMNVNGNEVFSVYRGRPIIRVIL